MKRIFVYKLIAISSFVILLGVQFYLAFNTYRLKDDNYFVADKQLMNEYYSQSVRDDKVFPGGQKIIDSFIYRNIYTLEKLYNTDRTAYNEAANRVSDSIFNALRTYSNMDSVFKSIVATGKLSRKLQYLLTVSRISISFKKFHYVALYNSDKNNPYIDKKIIIPQGVIISGKLASPKKQNLITPLTISAPTDYSYQISFTLYADRPDRQKIIFLHMLPVFLLSAFSILFVLLIYFYTYRNWLKQKQLADMQSDFVNSITHEFNTPLSTIIVANRNLQNPNIYNSAKMILPLTSIIERQSQRLKTLFGRVMDITKMNRATLNKEEYSLDNLMEEILLDYRLSLEEKNINIQYQNQYPKAFVKLDKFWFATMLINIMENGGKYNVSTIKKINIDISRQNSQILLSIQDNGVGMSEQKMKYIFDKFYRGNDNKISETSGLGLGLFYTKQCIRAHNWTIDVKSKEGEGTEFLIYIPEN